MLLFQMTPIGMEGSQAQAGIAKAADGGKGVLDAEVSNFDQAPLSDSS